MQQPFTLNLLVKFLYRETTASETLAVNEALNRDPALLAEYNGLLEGYQQLPKVKFRPSRQAVHNILGYSEQTALEKHA